MESVRDELTEDSPTPQSALLLRAGRVVDHDNKRYFAPTTTIVVPGADTMGKTAVEYIQGRVMNRQGTPFVNERDMGTLHKIIDRVVVHGDDSNFAPISPEGIIMPEADGQHILPYDERHGLHSHPAIDLNAQVRWEQPLSQTLAQLP